MSGERRESGGLKGTFREGRTWTGTARGLAVLLWLAIPLCTGADEGSPLPPAWVESIGALTPPVEGSSWASANRAERMEQNMVAVHTMQMQSLYAQQGQDTPSVRHTNRVTRWMDKTHQQLYFGMDDAVRWMDAKCRAEEMPYENELSTFTLQTLARVGGRSSEGESDFKVRFRADVALPELERRLHLTVENSDLNALPGADPLKQENDPRIEARVLMQPVRDSELAAGGGLKWRHSKPVGYVDLDWCWEAELADGTLRFNPRAFYFTDDGLGQMTTLGWMKQVGDCQLFQIRTAEHMSESLEGVEFEQTLRFAWFRPGKGRGWVAQASLFPRLVSSDWVWANSLLNVTWRDSLYRKWIYYTVTTQVEFPEEDDYEARPSIRVGLEILFGGEIRALM